MKILSFDQAGTYKKISKLILIYSLNSGYNCILYFNYQSHLLEGEEIYPYDRTHWIRQYE